VALVLFNAAISPGHRSACSVSAGQTGPRAMGMSPLQRRSMCTRSAYNSPGADGAQEGHLAGVPHRLEVTRSAVNNRLTRVKSRLLVITQSVVERRHADLRRPAQVQSVFCFFADESRDRGQLLADMVRQGQCG
jgi:hypothetical protein